MNTERKYSDGVPIPFYRYKCRAESMVIRTITPSTYTHTCKKHIDHDGDHICICGHTWKPASRAAA